MSTVDWRTDREEVPQRVDWRFRVDQFLSTRGIFEANEVADTLQLSWSWKKDHSVDLSMTDFEENKKYKKGIDRSNKRIITAAVNADGSGCVLASLPLPSTKAVSTMLLRLQWLSGRSSTISSPYRWWGIKTPVAALLSGVVICGFFRLWSVNQRSVRW